MGASVTSKAFTQSVSFDYDRNRQYLMFIVEGSATVSFEAGDTLIVDKSYEPLVVPISGFTIRDIVGRVVVVSNASTIQSGKVHRAVPYFNGISQYVDTGQRLVDVDNLNGFSFEIYIDDFSNGTIISQADSPSTAAREFQVFILGDMEVNVGGVRSNVLPSSLFPSGGANLKLSFNASNVDVFIDGSLVNTATYTTGAARQPSVNTLVFARGDGLGGVGYLKSGLAYNFKINDGSVYNFPMDDGWQNNPVMRNTGGGANGTYINMPEAAWQEITS